MSETDHAATRLRPTTLPVITRIRLPQRLCDDGWWLCPPPPQRPSARILRFPQMPARSRAETLRHD